MTENEQIIGVIIGILGELPQAVPGIGPETNITKELGLDSLAVMNFVMSLEDRFDVSITMDKLAGIETVSDLAATIAELKEPRAA